MLYLPFSGPGNSRKIPALGTSVSVFWTGEEAKKKSTQPKFNIVEQTLKKLAAIVPFTEEILEDSAINLTQLIATLFAEAVSKEEDIQFFAGVGTPWTGILNNGNVNVSYQAVVGVANVDADDLLDMQDEIPTGALNGAKYYLNRRTLNQIRKLKATDGHYIWQGPKDGTPGTIWNFPYELTDALPAPSEVETGDNYIIFGNLRMSCVFGDKGGQLRIKLLEEATINDTDDATGINLAEQDMVALRIVERVGYVLALPEAIVVLNSATSESPES
jgi:HK97 family phage major capsid protein